MGITITEFLHSLAPQETLTVTIQSKKSSCLQNCQPQQRGRVRRRAKRISSISGRVYFAPLAHEGLTLFTYREIAVEVRKCFSCLLV